MLIPRFSIRWLLIITTVFAGYSLLIKIAVDGQAWAAGIAIALGSLFLVMFVHAAFFLASWTLTSVTGLTRGTLFAKSPFAGAEPPPQIVEPRGPDEAQ
jgi:hypothetical protein